MNSAAKEHSVFLSYSFQDKPWVAEFADALQAAGIHGLFDPAALPAGSTFVDTLETALRQSDTLIIIFSPNSVENPNVLFELGAAFGGDKRIIPILIGSVDPKRIPFWLTLSRLHLLRAESPAEAGKQVAQIIQENARSASKTE